MSDIELTRLPGYDVNGNPRHICHYTDLLTEQERQYKRLCIIAMYIEKLERLYSLAVERAHRIGGKKHRSKRYDGMIVFQGYESVIRADIKRILAEAEKTGG